MKTLEQRVVEALKVLAKECPCCSCCGSDDEYKRLVVEVGEILGYRVVVGEFRVKSAVEPVS